MTLPEQEGYEMSKIDLDGRIYEGVELKPTCANCGSTNIKTSSAGNKYCADLCWVEEEQPKDEGTK